MATQEQIENTATKTAVFGDDGSTVVEYTDDGGNGAEAETQSAEGEAVQAEPSQAAPAPAKYRIGDREFASQEEMISYVASLEGETNAYRQGLVTQHGQATPPADIVTPPPQYNTEELYTNPQEFLAKFAADIKREAVGTVSAQQAQRDQDNAVWSEFVSTHPMMADFRSEVEEFTARNTSEVQAIAKVRGRKAAFDHVATKVRANFQRYAKALQPQRELPNSGAASAPATRASAAVTQKTEVKKPLSFADQVRSIRKGKK